MLLIRLALCNAQRALLSFAPQNRPAMHRYMACAGRNGKLTDAASRALHSCMPTERGHGNREREVQMATVTFTPPKHWEDWCDWALGIWLCLSPWALRYWQDPVATRNAVVVGFLIIFAEVATLSWFRAWEEWISVVLGAYLAVSPWLLGIAGPVPTANFVVVGVLVTALALYEALEVSRNPSQAKAD
jgi:hypothetical protein